MYDVTIYRLKVFTLVVERNGVGAAAEALGVSQPSVSRHLRGLEAVVGQPLFDRKPGRAGQLTDSGRALYRYAHDAVLGAENITDVFRDLQTGRRGHATIAVSRGLLHGALNFVLQTHYRRSPDVLVTVLSGTMAEVIHLVESGDVSFGLVTTVGTTSRLASRLLANVPQVVIAAPDHHLAGKSRVTPADLINEPCVIPFRSSTHYKLIFGLARQAGFRFNNIALEVDDGHAMSVMVQGSSAVAVALQTGVQEELSDGRLVALRTDPPLAEVELRMLARPNRRFSSSEERLMELVVSLLGEEMTEAEEPGGVVEVDH